MENAPMKPASKADTKKVEALLVNWVATSLRPFKVVEDQGFVALCKFLNGQAKLPGRAKHKEQFIKVSEMVMDRVTRLLREEMDHFTTTTESFMALTIHCLTADFERICFGSTPPLGFTYG